MGELTPDDLPPVPVCLLAGSHELLVRDEGHVFPVCEDVLGDWCPLGQTVRDDVCLLVHLERCEPAAHAGAGSDAQQPDRSPDDQLSQPLLAARGWCLERITTSGFSIHVDVGVVVTTSSKKALAVVAFMAFD